MGWGGVHRLPHLRRIQKKGLKIIALRDKREFPYGSQEKHCETMETADCTGQLPMEQVIANM